MSDEEEKIVYVLGAGFSRDAGAPLTNDFLNYNDCNVKLLDEYCQLLNVNMYELYLPYLKFLKENKNANIEYFARYIGNNKNKSLFITIEEVMNLCPKLTRDKIPHEIMRKGKMWMRGIMGVLDFYYFRLIHSKIESNYNPKSLEPYTKFFKHLIKSGHNSIITFNYDCIPEIFLYEYKKGFNYCFRKNNDKIDKALSIKNVKIDINNKIIKLHGSINWHYCNNCKRIAIDKFGTPNSYDYEPIENYKDCTNKCHVYYHDDMHKNYPYMKNKGTMQLLIAPPGDKTNRSEILKTLEKEAENELKEADKIIFIGNQLNEIDADARKLFDHRITKYKPNLKVEIFNSGNDKEPIKNLETFEKLFPKDSIVKSKHGYLKDYIKTIGVN